MKYRMLLTTAEITPAIAAAVMMDLNEGFIVVYFSFKDYEFHYAYNSYKYNSFRKFFTAF
jgi:hypothetical protein